MREGDHLLDVVFYGVSVVCYLCIPGGRARDEVVTGVYMVAESETSVLSRETQHGQPSLASFIHGQLASECNT